MRRVFIFIFFLTFCAFPMMAYESPITAPGATGVEDMYTTTTSSPNRASGGPNKVIGDNEEPDSENWDENHTPVGAPWILLGFAALYAGVRLVKRGRGVEE